MKYRNRSDNYYDTKVFKRKGKNVYGNLMSKHVITPEIIGQAADFLGTYRMLKIVRFVLFVLVIISPYLLIVPLAAIFMCYYMKEYNSVKLNYKMSKEEQETFGEYYKINVHNSY